MIGHLFRAEWLKIAGNRYNALLLVWIYPLSALLVLALAHLALLFPEARAGAALSTANWQQTSLGVFQIVNSELGRFLFIAFAATTFAGEYQYGTWKNLIPRQQRTALILMKFVAVVAFTLFGIVLATLIAGVLIYTWGLAAGATITTTLTTDEFVRSYLIELTVTACIVLFASGFAAIGGMITRSIIGSVVVGLLFVLGEQGVLVATMIIRQFIPSLTGILQAAFLTTNYNLANVTSWIRLERGFIYPSMSLEQITAPSLETSLLLLLVWVVVLVGGVVLLFRRQDIVT
jgi:ABC-2 type transport system permease protein